MMRHWNYRVYHNTVTGEFGIVECYYNEQDEPIHRSEDFMEPYGDSFEELRKDLARMVGALDKAVITDKDFKNP